jgi:glycosyltransferase involved in cell wall biosynthesis
MSDLNCSMAAGRRKRRLLLVAYSFPPAVTAAVMRNWNIARHLVKCGWEVTVVTVHPSIWRGLADRKPPVWPDGMRLLYTGHKYRFLTPEWLNCRNEGIAWVAGGIVRKVARRVGTDLMIGWIPSAQRTCSLLSQDDADVILGTGGAVVHQLASWVSKKLCRPCVLDYHDPRTGNPHEGRQSKKPIELERKRLETCAAAFIVSPSWLELMQSHFNLGSRFHMIPNGYDPDELERIEPHDFGHFAIVYAGSFYPSKREIDPLMSALRQLTTRKSGDWFFHYYGHQGEYVRRIATRFNVNDKVICHGPVDRAEALAAVRGAGVAVVITSIYDSQSLADRGIITGKLYDIIGLRTPVLLIAPPNSDAEVALRESAEIPAFRGTDVPGITDLLERAMQGAIPKPGIARGHIWPEIIRTMDNILRRVATSPADETSEHGLLSNTSSNS